MSSQLFDFARRDICLYQELWKTDHDEAMECFSLQDKLARGICVFDLITRIDEACRLRIYRGQVPYSDDALESIKALYLAWSTPCTEALKELDRFEKSGYAVDGAEEFRSRCREVQGILTDDDKFFSAEALIELRDKALDEHKRGQTLEHRAT